jgi:glycosyltransferase involved in cell wall biosynthesis
MAACIQNALRDSGLRIALQQKGISRAREFTWERCARQTLEVLMNAGQTNRN